jgi:hypothetical protein
MLRRRSHTRNQTGAARAKVESALRPSRTRWTIVRAT